jgi:hypothetical protein
MSSTGESIIAGDFSNYDGKIPAFVGKIFVEFMNRWYDDDSISKKCRESLFEHIYHATHIYGNRVYTVKDGNPSGNPMTSIYNSFCNIIMTYTILTCDLKLHPKEFEIACYGDDNIISIARPGVTCEDLAPHYMSRFGMTYTHFSKQGKTPEGGDTMSTIRYLGRAFVPSDGVILAPLKLEVVYESLYWYRKGNLIEEVMQSTLNSFFIELAHFPEIVYDQERKELRKAVAKYCPQLLSYFDTVAVPRSFHIIRKYFN